MSWDEEKILEGVIKKKLTLSSFYGKTKAGNIKAVIKDTEGAGVDELGDLPYGTSVPLKQYSLPNIGTYAYKTAAVYKNELHIMGGGSGHTKDHWKWDGYNWTLLGYIPVDIGVNNKTGAFIYHDKLHICTGNKFYVYDDEYNTWSEKVSIPRGVSWYISIGGSNTTVVYTTNTDSNGNQCCYKYENDTFTGISYPIDNTYQSYGSFIGSDDDNSVYFIGWRFNAAVGAMCKLSPGGTSWAGLATPPFRLVYSSNYYDSNKNWCGSIGCIEDKHIIYAVVQDYGVYFYNMLNDTWVLISKCPYHMQISSGGPADDLVIDNQIHVLNNNTETLLHAYFDEDVDRFYSDLEYLPYDFIDGSSVVFNDEIHIFGTSKPTDSQRTVSFKSKHFKWDGSKWNDISVLPYSFYNGCSVAFNGKMYILGGTDGKRNHYVWDNNRWSVASTLPYDFYNGCAVALDNEIHILGGTGLQTAHYKWDGDEWINVATIPINVLDGSAVVLNNEIHIFVGTKHYKWTGEEWQLVSASIPVNSSNGSATVLNNEIHILSGSSHYKWTGEEWINVGSLPYNFVRGTSELVNGYIYLLGGNDLLTYQKFTRFSSGSWVYPTKDKETFINGSAVIFNDEIHILGGTGDESNKKHYRLHNTTWVSTSELPFKFSNGSSIIYDNKLHIFGGYEASDSHYEWDGSEWAECPSLPYNFIAGSSVLLNNEIHILGSAYSGCERYHYKWNGVAWESISSLPYDFYRGIAIVASNKIHILGGVGTHSFSHYYYDNDEWIKLNDLESEVINCSAVMFNNEIHIFNDKDHIKLIDNLSELLDDSKLPESFKNGGLVVFDNAIHMLGGGSNKHYKFTDPGIKPVKLEDVEIYIY